MRTIDDQIADRLNELGLTPGCFDYADVGELDDFFSGKRVLVVRRSGKTRQVDLAEPGRPILAFLS